MCFTSCLFSQFWTHLEYCAMLLDSVCTSVHHDETESSDRVRNALKHLATTHLSLRGWAKITSEMNSIVDVGEDKVPLSSALIYLWEGAIPLVTAFCNSYTRLKKSGPSSKVYARLLTSRHLSVLQSFGQSVMVMCDFRILPF